MRKVIIKNKVLGRIIDSRLIWNNLISYNQNITCFAKFLCHILNDEDQLCKIDANFT